MRGLAADKNKLYTETMIFLWKISPLMGKVIFYHTCVSIESHARYRKSRKLEKPFFRPKCLTFSLQKIDKKLEDLSAHNL